MLLFIFLVYVFSVASRQHLRSASRGLLVVPRHRLCSYGRWAFSVAGPAIWNWLPDSLRDPAISRDSFRRSLKTFLFSAYSCVHSALELSGRCALQIYLLTYCLLTPSYSNRPVLQHFFSYHRRHHTPLRILRHCQ